MYSKPDAAVIDYTRKVINAQDTLDKRNPLQSLIDSFLFSPLILTSEHQQPKESGPRHWKNSPQSFAFQSSCHGYLIRNDFFLLVFTEILKDGWIIQTCHEARHQTLSMIAIFTSLIIASDYALAPIYNVKLMDTLVFASAYSFGFKVGASIAILSESIWSVVNPTGFLSIHYSVPCCG